MSINKLLFEEEKRNEFVSSSKDTLKNILGLGGLAAIVGSGMSKKGQSVHSRIKKGKHKTKLGEAGGMLKGSIDKAFEVRSSNSLKSANDFFDELIGESSKILKKTIAGALEDSPEEKASRDRLAGAIKNEKTYLLTAVRDAVRDLGLTGEAGTSNMLVSKIDEILESEMRNSDVLSEEVEGVLRGLRNTTPNDKKVEQYKRFKALKENQKFFSGRQKALGYAETLIRPKLSANTFDDAFKKAMMVGEGLTEDQVEKQFVARKKQFDFLAQELDTFKTTLNRFGGNVSGFSIIKEHEQQMASIYMNVGGRNKPIGFKPPLHLSNVANARKVVRLTSSLNTPSSITSFMPHADDIFSLLKENKSPQEVESVLRRSTPERYIRNMFGSYLESNNAMLDDLSEREVNKYLQHMRAQTMSMNRASLYTPTNNPLGDELAKNLGLQQYVNSSQGIVYGFQGSRREAQNIPIQLMKKYPQYFDAPQASATPLREGHIRGMGNLLGINFNLLQFDNKKTAASFNLLRGFGFKDRSTSPLTTREAQFFGREDLLSSIVLDKERAHEGGPKFTFGHSNISMMASNKSLLSVDPEVAASISNQKHSQLGQLKGANMAGLLFFGSGQASRAGLSEGQAYYGGTMEVEIPIQKSVLDPDKMNRPEFAYLRKLIENSKRKAGKRDYTIKGEEIAKIFNLYSDESGKLPLGEIDNRIVGVPRYQGLQELTLQLDPLEGAVQEKGRVKYAISGKARMSSDINKLFGVLGRTTSTGGPIDEAGVLKAINQSFGDSLPGAESRSLATQILNSYKGGFKGKMQNLLVGDSSGVTKSVDFIQNFMYGGYRMLGGTDEGLKKAKYSTRAEITKLSKEMEGEKFVNAERQIRRMKLIEHARNLVEGLKASGVTPDKTSMSLFLAPLKYIEGNAQLGIQEGDLESHVLKATGASVDQGVFKSGVAIGAASAFSGTPAQVLARNMAKFEPRHANILMYGMRTFFGLDTQQSVKYLNDFILRQEGVEYSGRYLGDITSMGLGFKSTMKKSVDDKPFKELSIENFNKLAISAQTNTRMDVSTGDQFRQDLIKTLDYDNPTVLRVGDVVKNKQNLNELSRIIPSGQIVIPSGRTIEGMVNYQIPKGDQVENIDAKLIGNLKGFFEHIYEIDSDLKPERRINALTSLIDDTIDTSALALRRSISGPVLGSVSMQGSGLNLNPKYQPVNVSGKDMANARLQYQKHKGYTLFSKTGGFVDSLSSFMGASTKTNIIKDGSDALSETNARSKMIDKFKGFMFSHLEEGFNPSRGVALRNPSMGVTHMLPGIALSRFDVSKRYEVANMLDKNVNQGLMSLVSSGEVSDNTLKSISFDKEKGITSISPEDIFKVEQEVFSNKGLRESLSRSQASEALNEFKTGMNKFFGTNTPSGINMNPGNLDQVNENLSRFKELRQTDTSPDLKSIESSLRKAKSKLEAPDKATKGLFSKAYLNIINNFHNAYGVGGSELIFPTFEADVKIKGRDKLISSRLDLAYSLVGDFDADTYQFFHETKNISQKAMLERGNDIIANISKASGKFGIVRNLLDESFATLGRKLSSGDMNLAKFTADQAQKEIILKNVGPVDVQFKTLLLGLVENSLNATPEKIEGARQTAYAIEHISDALVTSAIYQDTANLKVKKMPFAAELGNIISGALATSYKTGDPRVFEDVFENLVLKNSPELSQGFEIEDVNLRGSLPEIETMYKQNLNGQKISGREIMNTMSEGIRTVHREGLQFVASENKMASPMKAGGGSNKGVFESALMYRQAMEMGLLGEPTSFKDGGTVLDKTSHMLSKMSEAGAKTKSNVMKNLGGKGMAGLVGLGLVSSYALGASYSTSALSGPDKFSDMKVKNQIGNRAIYNNASYQHKNISAQSMRPENNMYQRQIMQKEMYVQKPSGIAISGNTSNINDAQKILQSVSAMGGKGHLSIQDNVLPRPNIADYYMRDY